MKAEQEQQLTGQFHIHALCALVFLLVCRIISMCFIPLNDVSEARYAEIARKMLETGNWVTPLHDYGVPFWAKPPLSIWLSALSMNFLGINEFAARLPALLLSMGVLGLIWDLAKKHSGSFVATVATLVLAGTLHFFLDAGTVMTDPSLVFCITLVFVAFWHAVVYRSKNWSYVFFIALGLGLLAKGPVAVILAGMPLFFWVLWHKQWGSLWKNLPWIKGILLLLLIALPWYIWAEIRTPGFLKYFILGENLNRFLVPGWTGDKYGFAHQEPWGMIWPFALMGIFPWCLLGGFWYLKYIPKKLEQKSSRLKTSLSKYLGYIPKHFADADGWLSYFFLCMVVPLIFFTFSRNIIYTYVFPSLPVFALFFAEYWHRVGVLIRAQRLIVGLSLVCGCIFLLATLAFYLVPERVAKTQKAVVSAWLKQAPLAGSCLIYWNYKTEFSAQFYSGGRVKFAQNKEELCHLSSNHLANYLAIDSSMVSTVPGELFAKMTRIQTVAAGDKHYFLMRIPSSIC